MSTDTKRITYSVGRKRSDVSSSESEVKCKRALCYDTSGSLFEVTLDEFATCGIIQEITVPYMANKVEMGKESIKLVFLNTFGLLVELHYGKLTLKGSFSSRHFLISPVTKKVTLRGIEPKKYMKGDSTLDKSRFVNMVKGMCRDKLPGDIRGWLECIENGGNNNVLKKHINMQHSSDIFGEFWTMFHALLEVKNLDYAKFHRIMARLQAYDLWDKRPFSWCKLQDNRRNQDQVHDDVAENRIREAEKDCVKDSAFGLMQEIRNCWAHPAKLYKDFLLAVLLGEYPYLLSDVQEALYDEGCLPQLDTKQL